MNKKYKIIFSKFAEDDLTEIIGYYQSNNNEFYRKLFFSIEEKINQLKDFPKHGRIVPELEKQNIVDYRELIEGNYRIIYVIHDRSIIIHTIIDSRRNLEELIIKKLMRSL
ncbi:MAG: type II toxin-antitoxin system RelE/ParE family toxin [Spirochaetales bacterium]|nr:type II toxin-antitoxin system RelE/ParE family toxin [Spirochaetales bacterium]